MEPVSKRLFPAVRNPGADDRDCRIRDGMAAAECTAGGSSPGGTGLRLKRAGFLTWFRTSGIKGALEMVNAERLLPWLGSAGPNRYGASGKRYGGNGRASCRERGGPSG